MRKKVTISGSFYGSNYGDHLFCDIFNDYIKQMENMDSYIKNPSDYIQETSRVRSDTFITSLNSDYVILASGGYFGENENEHVLKKIIRMKHHYLPAIVYRIINKKYSIVGVGVGPLKYRFTKMMIKYIFNGAKFISVRDEESLEYLKEIGIKRTDIIITTDTAVFAAEDIIKKTASDYNEILPRLISSDKYNVFFHIDPSNHVNRATLYKQIIKVLNETPEYHAIIMTDMRYSMDKDEEIKKLVFSELDNEKYTYVEYENPNQFTNILYNVDAIVTHKLHVGILGSAFNKAVVSLPIHNKVGRFFKQIEEEGRSIPINNLNEHEIYEHIKQYIVQPVKMRSKYLKQSSKNLEMVREFLNE